ncbi:MAG TPA: polysaccharide biosynthesis protein [Acidobacteriaceae bacterium]|jgi:FlaA1/EpsC-like NDP-sugar epimerase|nr:polysaccharide biosynthesis protein [Acidobacteriaceae bacterium]
MGAFISENVIKNKRVLVTGAGGYIGSALTKALLSRIPEHILLLDSAERNLYEIDSFINEGNHDVSHASILGSVTDEALLHELFERYRPQIIFHAAACKHVPLMESNPFAAVLHNAIGTHMLVSAAMRYGVEQFVLISTDKAADPRSIMGASKRIAELAVLSWNRSGAQAKVMRLVNVIGAQGSVVPRFQQQIAAGGPVTVTHPEAQRYFVTLPDAVHLLLLVASPEIEKGLYVPKVAAPVKIMDIARHLIAGNPSIPAKNIEIVISGLRPGDKLTETLLSAQESIQESWAQKVFDDASLNDGALIQINSPSMEAEKLSGTMQTLASAVQSHRLEDLLREVRHLVPEYLSDSGLGESRIAAVAAGSQR